MILVATAPGIITVTFTQVSISSAASPSVINFTSALAMCGSRRPTSDAGYILKLLIEGRLPQPMDSERRRA
jgi:hypothetical protein